MQSFLSPARFPRVVAARVCARLSAAVSLLAVIAATSANAQAPIPTPTPAAAAAAALAPQKLDEVSVTATRDARPTKDVPYSVTVVSRERLEAEKMMNVKEALTGTPGVQIDSKNGGHDVRLTIRGAGLSASYGVREIMVLRDGVPMTDPDSFTRFDFIDTQDIERIEVVRGPGSIYAAGAAGGAIQILSKSVFDTGSVARIGLGTRGQENYHLRAATSFGANNSQAVAVTASRRVQDNDWRRWNHFETNQIGLKYGVADLAGGTFESELSWSNALLQLPGSMNRTQFNQYRRDGRQRDSGDAFKYTGRDSEILFANAKYERAFGDFTFKPRVYATHWKHYHPVTGVINVSDQNYVFGLDLEGQLKHSVGGMPSKLVAGLSARGDLSLDARKYRYRDLSVANNRIIRTNSDIKGAQLSSEDDRNYLIGVFAEENIALSDKWALDVGARLDRSYFDIEVNEPYKYNYATGNYTVGGGRSHVSPDFTLFAPRAALSYKVTPQLTAYASIAQADQIAAASQLSTNPGLTTAQSRNYEIGLKHRGPVWSYDLAAFFNPVSDDITASLQNGQTIYQNAGKTKKKGFEAALAVQVAPWLKLGGAYTFADYEFDQFTEVVSGRTVRRDGKRVPLVPQHQYSVFAEVKRESGLRGRVQAVTFGDYWMDNANTQKYGGYSFVANASIAYEVGRHTVALNVDNIFNQKYATEAKRDVNGADSFSAAAPRTAMLTYSVKF